MKPAPDGFLAGIADSYAHSRTLHRLTEFVVRFWSSVVISMAACNNDPQIRAEQFAGNRSHLAWGAGPHVCPASSIAYMTAQNAIDQLLDALPEIRLAVAPSELTWRPDPFQRALTALPVVFPKSAPLREA